MSINEKYIPLREINNGVNWLVASNEEWVVPAGSKERRYLVLEVKNRVLKMTRAEKTRLAEVCPFSIAGYLYSIDLEDWDSTEIIDTQGLVNQKLMGLGSIESFWLHVITSGMYKHKFIPKENLYSTGYLLYCNEQKMKQVGKIVFYNKTKELLNLENCQKQIDGSRHHVFVLNSYEDMATSFNSYFGSECIDLTEVTEFLLDDKLDTGRLVL